MEFLNSLECNVYCNFGIQGETEIFECDNECELLIDHEVIMKIELINNSDDILRYISISHIKRVGGIIPQDSINYDKGKVDFIYDSLKWKLARLDIGEKAILTFKYLIEECTPFSITPLKVSYDYQINNDYFGPFDSNKFKIICIK
ncbi:MAG: hypothetical protein K0S34_1707 [Bacillales bacterium]|jgi:hypothetical protein|nr:hypothetical protein [Bacillales bacterium]